MIGYIAMYGIDHEGTYPTSDPSVLHPTREAAEAEAARDYPRADYYDSHAVEYPDAIPVPAPDGWAVVVLDNDGQLSMVPA